MTDLWRQLSGRRRRLAAVALCLLLAGCSSGAAPDAPRPFRALQSVEQSPLFVNFPVLDDRICQVDPDTGQASRCYYPDSWDPQADYVRDYAVDRERLFVLTGDRRPGRVRRLHAVSLDGGRPVRQIPIAPGAERLAWSCGGQLLVGHGTTHAGPAGLLAVVDPKQGSVDRKIQLRGSCAALAPFGARTAVIERTARQVGAEVVVTSAVALVDLEQGRVLRRRQVPPGAGQIAVGPSGMLYVAHSSDTGMMATDGMLSVLDPESLAVTGRLDLELIVRGVAASSRFLVLNMVTSTGDSWLGIQGAADETLSEFRPGELVAADVALLGGRATLALRRKPALYRADVRARANLPRLPVAPAHGDDDRVGALRTWMECRGD